MNILQYEYEFDFFLDVLNWWAGANVSTCRKLFPMSTVGDGNCLLHAVSLAMFGFHDRLLTLRKALHKSLATESGNGALKRRFELLTMYPSLCHYAFMHISCCF